MSLAFASALAIFSTLARFFEELAPRLLSPFPSTASTEEITASAASVNEDRLISEVFPSTDAVIVALRDETILGLDLEGNGVGRLITMSTPFRSDKGSLNGVLLLTWIGF
jgi:hypothetical protein